MSTLAQRQELLDRQFALRRIDCAGRQLAYRTNSPKVSAGETAIVALHGIGSGSVSWMDAALALPGIPFIAWDAPGYGESAPLTQAQPLASDYADALTSLLEALQITQCVLVGHSLGALMAAAHMASSHVASSHVASSHVARSNTRYVQRCVLISPARGYGHDTQAALHTRNERLRALDTLGIPTMAAQRSSRLLSANATDEARDWVRWAMASLDPSGYRQAVEMLCADDITRYGPINTPLTVHCGDADIITPQAACRDIATNFGASFELIANAGHASPVEQAHAVAQLLRNEYRLLETAHV
jgi:pimeloyl-ACP methyl ester carboxylesterase